MKHSLQVLIEKGFLSEKLKAIFDSSYTYEWAWLKSYPDEAKISHLFRGHPVAASKFMRGGGVEGVKKISIPTINGPRLLIDCLPMAYQNPYLIVALYSMTNMLKHGGTTVVGLRWDKSYPSEVFVFYLDESKNVKGEQIL